MSQHRRTAGGLPSDFSARLEARLRAADVERSRHATVRRWRWMGIVGLPLVGAACWAALPWTFGTGARSLIGFATYFTLMMAVAHRADSSFLAYLGIGVLPVLIDALLLIGVVSWLVWASRAAQRQSSPPEYES
jgi:hypothetical protein